MKTPAESGKEVRQPSHPDKESLRSRLEDDLEFTEEFTARIEQAKADIAAGHSRAVHP